MNRQTFALICVVLAVYLAGASSTACDGMSNILLWC